MPRRDRLVKERRHDPYEPQGKLAEPSACPTCHAVYREGRWCWVRPTADATPVTCPACRRKEDDQPAGVLTLAGRFHHEHRAEILGLIRHVEDRETKSHPMKRIMDVTEADDEVRITTCEAGLARSLGDAIHHAYRGTLDYRYPEGSGVLRVRWER